MKQKCIKCLKSVDGCFKNKAFTPNDNLNFMFGELTEKGFICGECYSLTNKYPVFTWNGYWLGIK